MLLIKKQIYWVSLKPALSVKFILIIVDMTQREGQLECALTNGYVVIFKEETQDEYFIPNSDIAIDSQMFNDENSQPFNSYTVTATNGDLAIGIDHFWIADRICDGKLYFFTFPSISFYQSLTFWISRLNKILKF